MKRFNKLWEEFYNKYVTLYKSVGNANEDDTQREREREFN